MIKKIDHIRILFLIFLFLPKELYAFDTIRNLPSRNPYFTGRLSYLNTMQKMLLQYGKVYLTGYGGIGKSQIAKEFSYINEQEYDLIWWFDLRGNVKIQYENLLIHLSNNKKFKELLHVKPKDIAPSVLIEFIHSLLVQYQCRWLLIYDNALGNDIKFPKTKATGHHVIITTREKPIFGDNVLTLGPFASYESGQFLLKIHPREKKEDIIELCNTLHDYPLALAQTSEEILMYKNGISTYLKKYNKVNDNKDTSLHSELTQGYDRDYRRVLNHTLQDIEQKADEAAKVLYMLALLKTDFTKELLKNLLVGERLEGNWMTLSKYGVIQITDYGNSQVLSIHDVIRNVAIERFNNKSVAYKKKIIITLSKYFDNFYSNKSFQYLSLDITNDQVAPLYAFVDVALQNNILDEGVINAVIVSLKLNDTMFRHGNYVLYQRIANKVYGKNIDNITPVKKALLYAHLVGADFVFESKESFLKYEKEFLQLLNIVEKDKNYKELFFIYTNLSLLYLFLRDLKEAENYIEKAEKVIGYSDDMFSLLQYWHTNIRLYYVLRDVNKGLQAAEIYENLINQLQPGKINKFSSKSLKIKLYSLDGQKDRAKKELEEIMKRAKIYYNNTLVDTIGYLEFAKALLYFQNNQYDLALIHNAQALSILNKVLGDDKCSSIYVAAHLMLGEIYEKKANYKLALAEYNKCLKFYNKQSFGRINNFYEYGELLSNLCYLHYKQENYTESLYYFRKLVEDFDLDHNIVEKLIKKLPPKYMYKVGSIG